MLLFLRLSGNGINSGCHTWFTSAAIMLEEICEKIKLNKAWFKISYHTTWHWQNLSFCPPIDAGTSTGTIDHYDLAMTLQGRKGYRVPAATFARLQGV